MMVLHTLALSVCFLLSVQASELQTHDRTITQVVTLLQEMLDKSKVDSATERDLYGKYKCYCDTNEEEKTAEIAAYQKDIGLLENGIEELLASSATLSNEVAQLKKDMLENQEARATAIDLRAQELQDFQAKQTDLSDGIDQMRRAIAELAEVGADQTLSVAAGHTQYMANYNDSFPELKSSLEQALIAASAFLSKTQVATVDTFLQTPAQVSGGDSRNRRTSFLQASSAPFTGTYSAQSGEVVGILKDMRKTFEAELDAAIDTEAKAVTAHGKFIATKLAAHEILSQAHDKNTLILAGNDESLATKRTDLTTAQGALSGAESFLEVLVGMCSEKKKQYAERVVLRSKEEAAIAEAISILNSDAAFATFGTVSATKDGPVSFLQNRAMRRHGGEGRDSPRQKATTLLQKTAGAKGSPLLSRVISMLQANNPFTVVLKEIDNMITLIAEEELADDEQKSWCDEERTDTDALIVTRGTEITTLEGEIDQLGTDIDGPLVGLKVRIAQTETALDTNHQSKLTETEARQGENKAFQQDVANLVEAEALLTKAIKVLHDYYSKITSEMSGDQTGFLQREEPLPPSTWDDAYNGQSVRSGNAIDMLKVVLANAQAEETQAHEEEQQAQSLYEGSMTALKSEEASLRSSLGSFQEELAQKEQELIAKDKDLAATTKEKQALHAYLQKIKPGCDFITTNIDTRKSNRVEETAALRNAKDFLEASPAYTEALEAAHNETLGDCLSICAGSEDHVNCKACRRGVTVPGYCAGHSSTTGC